MEGIVIGLLTFLLIGIFHPIVIKAEYYWGLKSIKYFVLAGLIFAAWSIYMENLVSSILLGVVACCCFWSILEVKEQEERVLKGWFPMNPAREEYYLAKRKQYVEENS